MPQSTTNTALRLFGSILACAAFVETSLAQTPAQAPVISAPVATGAVSVASQTPPASPQWNVRVEALMVNLPEEKAIPFLRELLSTDQVDAAVDKLLAAVERKEATLTGYPVVQTHTGERATTESVIEKLYPTHFELPTVLGSSKDLQSTASRAAEAPNYVLPTGFEKRNVGVTLEVEPTVLPGGERINLNLQLQRVIIMGVDSYDAFRVPTGATGKIEQPRFNTLKDSVSTTLRNNQWMLLSVHKLMEGPDLVEFFLIRSIATQAR